MGTMLCGGRHSLENYRNNHSLIFLNKQYIINPIHSIYYNFSLYFSFISTGLVDDRLAGEGTGKGLGINEPILGWVILAVLTTVWALFYTSTSELGGQREEDGLGL